MKRAPWSPTPGAPRRRGRGERHLDGGSWGEVIPKNALSSPPLPQRVGHQHPSPAKADSGKLCHPKPANNSTSSNLPQEGTSAKTLAALKDPAIDEGDGARPTNPILIYIKEGVCTPDINVAVPQPPAPARTHGSEADQPGRRRRSPKIRLQEL